MATTNSKLKLSYAFSFGLTGGPWHAKKFKRLMQKSGFVYTPYTQKANVIIAHSAGCWLTPADSCPRLVVYAGTPGTHQDIWYNSAAYVEIIEAYARLLA